ncbi:MAG: hypothetical protein ACREO0_10480, partial [Pseudoxanthomonas sp.]
MFFSCLHCRGLVATDPETKLPPALCPRCGGVLREENASAVAESGGAPAKNGPSLASLLHGAAAIPIVAETGTRDPAQVATDGETSDAAEAAADGAVDGDSSDSIAQDEAPAVG